MNKLRVLELFGGIGACSKALEKLGIDYEIADYVEIDKYAVKSFNAIHNTNFEPQDITTWNKDIEADLIMHGSPCQDFSLAGKQAGGDEGSGTRSSLMYETIRIVKKLKPKYIIWENVKNLLSNKHRHNFDSYLEIMESLGYQNYYQVLNAKDYGIPQNRERVFTISIRNDINKEFIFPEKQGLKLKLKDMLEDEVDEKYYLSDDKIDMISHWNCFEKPFKKVYGKNSTLGTLTTRSGAECGGLKVYSNDLEDTTNLQEQCLNIKNATKKGYQEAYNGDSVNLAYPESETRRGRVGNQVSQTLQCNDSMGVVSDLRIRKLTPKECWRLMGFDDEDFDKASKVNSNAQLYKQAGNSIVVNVLMAIFNELLKRRISMKYNHKDGKDFNFLIGKSIIKVEEKQVKDKYGYNVDGYILTCKDGTIIEIATNEGCGGCRNGWSSFEDLKKLEENNNIITNIEVEYTSDSWDDDEFIMFIYYEDNTINQIKGNDGYGNGYYGGGFYVTIKDVENKGE